MADKKPLYQDEKLKIDDHPTSSDDHMLYIKAKGKWAQYVLQRGVLEQLARTPRGQIPGLGRLIHDLIWQSLEDANISVDGLHVAICQAYAEEERQAREYRKELERDNDDRRENSDAF